MTMRTGTSKTSEERRMSRRSSDSGISLIEVTIAIALTGGVVISILGAVFGVVRATSQNAQATRIQAVVGGAADQLNSVEWEPCPDGSDRYANAVAASADRVGWDPSAVSIQDIDYWDPTAGSWAENCNGAAALGTSETLQRVTIKVETPGAAQSKTFDIVKSNTTPFSAGGPG